MYIKPILKPGMANNKRIYTRRPKLIDTRYTQLQLFTDNGEAVRFLPTVNVRAVFNEFAYRVESNRPAMYAYALNLCRNSTEAEDLVQESIIRALNSETRYKEQNLTGWLIRIIKNEFLNLCRYKKKVNAGFDKANEKYNQPDYNMGESNTVIKDIHDAIDKLRDDQKKMAVMRFVNLETCAEIALKLDMPLGTVKAYLYYIRKDLKRELKEYRP